MLAAGQEDSTDIVAALIEAKADPNIRDKVYTIINYASVCVAITLLIHHATN